MASFQQEHLRHDRQAWEQAVAQILGKIPDRAVGDDAERLVFALRSVSSLLTRLSPKDLAPKELAPKELAPKELVDERAAA